MCVDVLCHLGKMENRFSKHFLMLGFTYKQLFNLSQFALEIWCYENQQNIMSLITYCWGNGSGPSLKLTVNGLGRPNRGFTSITRIRESIESPRKTCSSCTPTKFGSPKVQRPRKLHQTFGGAEHFMGKVKSCIRRAFQHIVPGQASYDAWLITYR